MTEHDLIQNGVDAKALLESDAFNRLFELIKNEMALQMLRTAPSEMSTREQFYFTARGMEAFEHALVSMVSTMENVLAMRDAQNEADAQEANSR